MIKCRPGIESGFNQLSSFSSPACFFFRMPEWSLMEPDFGFFWKVLILVFIYILALNVEIWNASFSEQKGEIDTFNSLTTHASSLPLYIWCFECVFPYMILNKHLLQNGLINSYRPSCSSRTFLSRFENGYFWNRKIKCLKCNFLNSG